MQYVILACFKNLLQEKFDKLNNKADKYGTGQLSFEIIKSFEENGKEKLLIEIDGFSPKIGNYSLVSVIAKLPDGTSIINNVPGEETPVNFRDNDFFCDHCKTNRYRKEVVIVREDDKYIQLGKNCLVEYLGVNLEQLVNRFSYVSDLIQEYNNEEYGPREELVISPEYFLRNVSVVCRKIGYVSSNKAYDQGLCSTKQQSWDITFPNSFIQKFINEKELFVEDQDIELAAKAIEWAKNLKGENDYERNILALIKQDYITYKYAGYIASIIPSYQRFVSAELERSKTQQSEWVGEPKQRLDLAVQCTFKKTFESDYGLKTILKFNSNGNQLTWFASGESEFKVGENYMIKATVKGHDQYNSVKQTVVNRVKIIAEKVVD